MDGYIQIYTLIALLAIASGLITGYKRKETIKESLLFAVCYYYSLSVYRTVQGHGSELLGQAFAGKNLLSYCKIVVFVVAVGIMIMVLRKLRIVDVFLSLTTSVGVAMHIAYSVCINIPSIYVITIEGIVAGLIALITLLLNNSTLGTRIANRLSPVTSNKYLTLHMLAWVMLCIIVCPTETYANNTRDYLLSYTNFVPFLLLSGIIYVVAIWFFNKYLLSGWLSRLLSYVIFTYTVLCYIQSMFLNGQMSVLEGVEQQWNTNQIIINLIAWCVLIIAVLIVMLKVKKSSEITAFVSGAIAALQLLALVSILISSGLIGDSKPYLSNENRFELSKDENVVVFILDTYDKQMIDLVSEADPDFLTPLVDFTYYDNMVSRFGYTDGSLPYLLTGVLAEEYTSKDIFDKSTFMKDIKAANYDIRLYTETGYAEYFDDGIIDNLTTGSNITIDSGKCVRQMLIASRYRNMPYICKPYYAYDGRDFDNIISDKNVVIFGDDEEFYESLTTDNVSIGDASGCFRLYHLYGAHSPYNFRESMTYDYSSDDPMAQWRACLSIVYEYIAQLKALDIYDNTTIIIMADHGPNVKQRAFLSELGIAMSDELHPIFFIKRRDEIHDDMLVDSRSTSHDVFQATVMEEIDPNNTKYGDAVWE